MDLPVWVSLLILGGTVVLSGLLGHWLARAWRLNDYGMSLSVVIGSVALAAAVCILLWPPKLGIDLSGGVILIYEIDREATALQQDAQDGPRRQVTSADIVPAIQMRLNPSGLEDVVVRPYGDDQVEVIIPRVEQAEIDRIKNIISQAGFLEFRIVANSNDHDYIIEAALDDANRGARQIKDEDGRTIGLWSALGRQLQGPNTGELRMSPLGTIFRNGDTGEVLTDENGNLRSEFLPADSGERNRLFESFGEDQQGVKNLQDYFADKLGIKNIDVLMAADDGYNVRGDHVDSVASGFDEQAFPSINFTMTAEGGVLFQGLTGENSPDPQTGFQRRLGILMDNNLISAPNLRSMISRNGQITGRFTQQEVDDLVQIIRGGSLPAALSPQPATESQISPLLGGVTIRQSVLALSLSLVFTLIVLVIYYRFAGLVACYALLANLAITVAVMILLKASFTLPGIAGLLLSVGMSVDANILIYERIREELGRGSKMRMALRNGFARATTTIIDSNVTTIIAGVVLYAIGTDVIRGFAVTLILGLLTSMFTAVFCARVILEVGERRHWYRDLYMMQWVKQTNLDFMGKRKILVTASAIMIAVGLAAAAARGVDLLDIDLAGGTSVDILLTEPLTEEELREKLDKEKFLALYHEIAAADKAALSETPNNESRIALLDEELKITDFDMTLLGLPEYTDDEGRPLAFGQAWRIDTSIPSVERLEATLQRIFAEGDGAKLVMREVEFTAPQAIAAAEPAKTPEKTTSEKTSPKTDGGAKPATDTTPPATSETPAAETPSAPAETPKSPSETPANEPAADDASAPMPTEPMPAEPTPSETPASEAPAEATPDADPRAAEPSPPTAPEAAAATDGARQDLPGPHEFAMAGDGDLTLLAQADTAAPADEAAPANEAAPADNTAPADTAEGDAAAETPAAETPPAAQAAGAATPSAPVRGRSESELTSRYRVSDDALKFQLVDAAEKLGIDLNVDRLEIVSQDDLGKKWTVRLPLPPDQAQRVLEQFQSSMANSAVFPSASKIGSKVASNMQRTAILSMVLSFFGIVVYLWIRFQRVAYGLAAIIATVHDILITLGIVALSHWLAPVFGFLLIENFKISLSVIAAFLTLVGYSINDTIVVFDRIREVKGKSPRLTLAMVNDSVNQTLGRTILTGGTVLVSLIILYVVGGAGIRGFAFTMIVGIIVGTFSSIYIGPPILLWLAEGARKMPETSGASEQLSKMPAERA